MPSEHRARGKNGPFSALKETITLCEVSKKRRLISAGSNQSDAFFRPSDVACLQSVSLRKTRHDEHMFSARATLTDMCPVALAGKVIVSAFPKPGSERRPQAATARPSDTGLRLDSEFEIEPIGGARLGRSPTGPRART